MDTQSTEKLEQARLTLVDAILYFHEAHEIIKQHGEEPDALEDENLKTHIEKLEEIAEMIEEYQTRFE